MRSTEVVAVCAALATAALLGLAGARAHAASETEATREKAEHLLHVLSYLDADYVRVGPREQKEHLDLAERAEALAKELPPPAGGDHCHANDLGDHCLANDLLVARVAEVRTGILQQAAEADMHERLGALRAELVARYAIDRAPRRAPDAARGRMLYEQHCASCHGMTGEADTPVAATLRPHPPSFQDAFFVSTLTPYDVTTAIRFGVDGTPMAPVAALDARDRWDVAAWVLGMRDRAPAAAASAHVTPSPSPANANAAPEVPCSEPGFSRGPALHPSDGGLPFEVMHDCMFPGQTRLEVAVSVKQKERPRRSQVEALLRGLLEQVRTAAAPNMPEITHICAFPDGTVDGTGRYGCLELEADEGPQGELSVQIDLPFETSEWLPAFQASHPGGTVTVDESKGEVEVTVALPEGEPVTTGRAAVQAFPWLFDFYPPTTEARALTVRATKRGRVVFTLHVADLDAFLAMNPWPIRERMAAAHVPVDPSAPRTPEQEAMLEKEYASALAKLPRGSVVTRL